MQFQDATPNIRKVLVTLDQNDMAQLQEEYDAMGVTDSRCPEFIELLVTNVLGVEPKTPVVAPADVTPPEPEPEPDPDPSPAAAEALDEPVDVGSQKRKHGVHVR